MKKKFMAIWMVFLFVAIPFSFAEAGETQAIQENNETISIELATLNDDNILSIEAITISEEELIELENTISILMDKIESANSWEEIENIINNIPKNNGIISSLISKFLSMFKLFRNRGFVISSGHGYKFNPFKKNVLSIRKKFIFWRYSSEKLIKDRTIIYKPIFKLNILKGRQFGYMRNFFGIYLFVSRRFPQKSYTFFMGTARRISGREI
ncbi:MAG: hypothetical protein KAW45_05335 [Thermoplasmatales archaeon]|nr:hypothetical protein [Thermoplasmatales archaeon]